MTIQVMTLVESKAREEKAAELELWRQAYNAYLSGYAVAGQLEGPDGPGRYASELLSGVADRAGRLPEEA